MRRFFVKKWSLVLISMSVFMVIFSFAYPCKAVAKAKYVLKGGYAPSQQTQLYSTMEKFKEEVEKRSKGEVAVEHYCCAMFGSDNEILEKVMMNALQFGNASTSNLANIDNSWYAYEFPYLMMNLDDNVKLLYEGGKLGGPIYEKLQKELYKKNLEILYVGAVYTRALMTRVGPIRVPKDAAGLKIRVTASDIDRAGVASWGAKPVAMGYGEVYSALQLGTIDGLATALDQMAPMKFHEVSKYAVECAYNSFSQVTLISADYLKSLPPNIQKIIRESATAAMEFEQRAVRKYIEDGVATVKKEGVQVYYPTPEDMKKWEDVTVAAIRKEFVPRVIKTDWFEAWKERLKK